MEIIRVAAAGNPGAHGSGPGDYPFRPLEAPFAHNGVNGQSAARPTAGTPGHNINVRLGYSDAEPALVQIAGEGAYTGNLWKIHQGQE
jgi:hypothetical protein